MRKTVLITGASGGIGNAFARLFAAKGHDLVLVARQRQKLEAIKQTLEGAHPIKVHVIACDLSIVGSPKDIYNDLKQNSIPIDILINNAGAGLWGRFIETRWDKELHIMQLNVVNLVHLTKLILPQMIKRGEGAVLNVASTVGFVPGPLMSIYYASKSFLLSFSQALSCELKGTGVSVTTLCPGPTQTDFQQTAEVKKPGLQGMASAERVAEFGYRALLKKQRVAIYGFKNNVLVGLTQVLPRNLVANIMYKVQQCRD